MSLPWILYCN